MKKRRFLAVILAVLMIVGLMAGCTIDETQESPDTTETVTEEPCDLAVCIASEPQTLDPALNVSTDGGIMLQHFFEGLLKWQDNGQAIDDSADGAELVGGQAESWDKVQNDDGTVTYTFKLRDGIMWSDGQPVTAGDFVYAWQRLADPETAAGYSYMIDMVEGFDEVAYGTPTGETDAAGNDVVEYADPDTLAVSAPDDDTFVVTLTWDCPYFEEICAFPATFPVRSDIIEANGDQWTFDPSTYVSNGPYVLSEWSHNSNIMAVKNEYYYDADSITANSIDFYLMDDSSAILSAFDSGTLQFVQDIPVDEVATRLSTGELNVADYIGTYFVCFNNQEAPFDDALVREAFSLVIDRNYIVEKVTQTGEDPATGCVPYGIFDIDGSTGDNFRVTGGDYYSVSSEDYEANCEKARELLSEAGYPDGEGFPAVEYLYNTNENNKAIAEALQQMWTTELGVTVTLSNQEWGVFIQNCMEGSYQISCIDWIADYNDPSSFLDMWYSDNGNNIAHYDSADYDAMIDAAKSASDEEERMEKYHQAEDILIGTDSAVAPVYFDTQKFMLDDSIGGLYYTTLGYFFFGHCYTKAE